MSKSSSSRGVEITACDVYVDREWGRRMRGRFLLSLCAMRRERKHFLPSRARRLVYDFFRESRTRAISVGVDAKVKVWDLHGTTSSGISSSNSTDAARVVRTFDGHGEMNCCAVFADGTRVVTGSSDRTLKIWNLAEGTLLRTLEGHTGWVNCCAVFADGTRLLSGSNDHTLKIWDLADGALIRTLAGHARSTVLCCAVYFFEADGTTRAISGSADKTLKEWNLATGAHLRTFFTGHTRGITCCAVTVNFTPPWAISGSQDGSINVWDLTNGTFRRTLEGRSGWLRCCAVFADGLRVVGGRMVGEGFKIWDLINGTLVHVFDEGDGRTHQYRPRSRDLLRDVRRRHPHDQRDVGRNARGA